MVLQFAKLVESATVVLEGSRGVPKEIFVLLNPEESVVYSKLHGLTNATIQTHRPAASCERVISGWDLNGDNSSFSPVKETRDQSYARNRMRRPIGL
jgi:hypothetical protein